MTEKITPQDLTDEPVDDSEPPAEPHQFGEPGHPESVIVPRTLPRSTDLGVPPNVRTLINMRDRTIE